MKKTSYLSVEQIEKIAKEIRQKCDVADDFFIDITDLAQRGGITVEEADFDDNLVSGTLESNNEGSVTIKINRNESEERKRFTIAHEIAHYVLHHNQGETSFIDYRQDQSYYTTSGDLRKEIQANMLAAALLMPKEKVIEAWERCHNVDQFAKLFSVSKKAAAIRLDNLGLIE